MTRKCRRCRCSTRARVTGPVFASQSGYLALAVGVLVGILIFDERHSGWVWIAVLLLLIGMSLVRERVHRSGDAHARVGELMSVLNVTIQAVAQPCDPRAWHGESSCWARFGAPMISLAGDFPLFHTPEDTAERATTPVLLERVDGVLRDAVRAALVG